MDKISNTNKVTFARIIINQMLEEFLNAREFEPDQKYVNKLFASMSSKHFLMCNYNQFRFSVYQQSFMYYGLSLVEQYYFYEELAGTNGIDAVSRKKFKDILLQELKRLSSEMEREFEVNERKASAS